MPDSVPDVAMVGDADETSQLDVPESGFFPDFPYCRHLDVFSSLLMAFGKVPQSVSSYQKAVIPPVGNHASCGIHFLELGAEIPVGLFLVLDRYIDPCQGA